MALWGCQIGSEFLTCAGTMYTPTERALLGAIVVLLATAGSFIVVRLANPQ